MGHCLSAASPSSTLTPALIAKMHRGIMVKRNRRQSGTAVAFLCQGKSEGGRAWAFDVIHEHLQVWNMWTLCSCSCLDCPPKPKHRVIKDLLFFLFWIPPGVAGKHRTNTVKGEIRGTFGRGSIPSKGLEKQEGHTKQNRNLEQWKCQDPGIKLRS